MIRRILTAVLTSVLIAVALISVSSAVPGLLENVARACQMGVNCYRPVHPAVLLLKAEKMKTIRDNRLRWRFVGDQLLSERTSEH